VVAVTTAGAFLLWKGRPSGLRTARVFGWLRSPSLQDSRVISAGSRCGDAPFIFPTTGIAGFLWDDSFRIGHRHQGVDIFSGTDVNVTPVIAAYAGYLTRLPEWKSTVIVRVPDDPLSPGRQIWVYYTHMADAQGNSFIADEFPPGTSEKYVESGALLGRQGDYSGDPNNPVGVHLHISIVRDEGGRFLNELEIGNTYDPSPYFGLALNARSSPDDAPACPSATPTQ
jgi:hypothetical protein